MSEEPNWMTIGVAAALSREYASEGKAFIPHLHHLLEQALPDLVEPVLSGGLLSRKTVVGLRVNLGDFQYTLDGGAKGMVKASRSHTVRGIALKSEEMDITEWLAEVGAYIEAQMQHNSRVRSALGDLLGLP